MIGIFICVLISGIILIPLWIKWLNYQQGGWEEQEKLISYINFIVNITLFVIVLFVIIMLIIYRGDIEMPQGLISFLSQVFVSVCSSAFVSLILYFGVLRKLPQNTKDHVNQAMDSKVLEINDNTNKTENHLVNKLNDDRSQLTDYHNNRQTEHATLNKEHDKIQSEIQRLVEDMVRREGMKANDNTGGIRAAETAMQVLIEKVQSEEKLRARIQELEIKNQTLERENRRLAREQQNDRKQPQQQIEIENDLDL